MKQLTDISSNAAFYAALLFIFLTNFSIAGCYIVFTLPALQLIITSVKRKALPEVPKYFKYFLLYMFFSFIATLFSIDRAASIIDNKEFFVFLLIPIFLLVLNTRKRLEYSLATVLASGLLSSLVGIAITLHRGGASLDDRLKGFTSHWMTYSGLLMFAFIFFFIYLFYEKRVKIKIVLSVVLAPILAAILLSLTRSVWVGIAVALGLFIVYYKPKILYAALPAAVLLFFILPQSVTSRITSIVDMNNETNRDRIYMFKTGMNILKDYPLTGVGPATVHQVYDRYKPAEAVLSNPHLHNNFLQVLVERGFLTLLSLLAAFVSIFLLLVNKIKNSIGFEKTIAVGSLFAVIGFLTAGMFEYNFGDTEILFTLLYFLSIPFIKLKDEKNIYVEKEDNHETNGAPVT